MVNRVGDFGLILGMAAIYFTVGSLEFDNVFAAANALAEGQLEFLGLTLPALTTICLLLFMGAMGKSAQFLRTHGCLMQWKARHLYLRSFTRLPW